MAINIIYGISYKYIYIYGFLVINILVLVIGAFCYRGNLGGLAVGGCRTNKPPTPTPTDAEHAKQYLIYIYQHETRVKSPLLQGTKKTRKPLFIRVYALLYYFVYVVFDYFLITFYGVMSLFVAFIVCFGCSFIANCCCPFVADKIGNESAVSMFMRCSLII